MSDTYQFLNLIDLYDQRKPHEFKLMSVDDALYNFSLLKDLVCDAYSSKDFDSLDRTLRRVQFVILSLKNRPTKEEIRNSLFGSTGSWEFMQFSNKASKSLLSGNFKSSNV